jgi:hypothetical protein
MNYLYIIGGLLVLGFFGLGVYALTSGDYSDETLDTTNFDGETDEDDGFGDDETENETTTEESNSPATASGLTVVATGNTNTEGQA